MTIPRIDSLDRNYFINGGMDYSQRIGNGQDSVSASEYFFDRWKNERSGNWSGSPTIQRVAASIPGQIKLTKAIQMSGANAVDGTAESFTEQRIESIFAQELAGKPVSFKFHYNESEFQQVDIKFFSADVKDIFSAVTQIGATVTKTLTPDSTWRDIVLENVVMPNDVARGLRVQITLKNPENTGVAITSQLTGFKLNIGTKAQNFSYTGRDLVEELQLIRRYFWKSYSLDTPVGTITGADTTARYSNSDGAANVWYHNIDLPVEMRIAPIVTGYNPFTGGIQTAWRRFDNGNNGTVIESNYSPAKLFDKISATTPGNTYIKQLSADAEL